MSTTSQNRVAQAAPNAPYRGISVRLRIAFSAVAPTKFQVLNLSRPDMMRIFDNKKFIKNKRTTPERMSKTEMEGRNVSPYIKVMIP